MKPQPVGDLAAGEEVAPERLLLAQGFFLIDGLDAQVVGAADGIVGPGDLPVADIEPAGGRLLHAGDDLDQGRFAGAVVADQADDLVGADLEIDIAQRDDVAIGHGHVFEPHRVPVIGGSRHALPPKTAPASPVGLRHFGGGAMFPRRIKQPTGAMGSRTICHTIEIRELRHGRHAMPQVRRLPVSRFGPTTPAQRSGRRPRACVMDNKQKELIPP